MLIHLLFVLLPMAMAQSEAVYHIDIKDHVMTPAEINVKAGDSFWIEVKNNDNTSEEFESNSLKIEKIVGPKRTIKVKVNDVKAGTHQIFGEFHMDSCKGTVKAAAQ